MSLSRNPGRVAGLWYLCLVLLGPVRLIYIPNKLFDFENPAVTVGNLAAHETLFRLGMVSQVVGAAVLIFLTLAFYRLFKGVDKHLAVLVVILGGVMPALINFVEVVYDAGALIAARGADSLAAFDKPQRDALVVLLLRVHGQQDTAAELLWGLWLFPLALLVYRSRFLPRFLGVWLIVNGFAYVALCLTGLLAPQYQGKVFLYGQPAMFGELALMLWLVIRGAKLPSVRVRQGVRSPRLGAPGAGPGKGPPGEGARQ